MSESDSDDDFGPMPISSAVDGHIYQMTLNVFIIVLF
jgi:hypothetical protein